MSYNFWTEIGNSVRSDIFECVITSATSYVISIAVYYELQRWSVSKPSLKIRTASANFWNYLSIRDYGLNYIFFRSKFFVRSNFGRNDGSINSF